MNALKGTIEQVHVHGALSLVDIRVDNTPLRSIVIETPDTAPYLVAGRAIQVLFKETEVIIGKGEVFAISLQNRLPCVIRHIDTGSVLSRLCLRFGDHEIISVITTHAVTQLGLHDGDTVMAMVKTNEIMLSES